MHTANVYTSCPRYCIVCIYVNKHIFRPIGIIIQCYIIWNVVTNMNLENIFFPEYRAMQSGQCNRFPVVWKSLVIWFSQLVVAEDSTVLW